MYEVSKKYKDVELLIHNIEGRVVNLHGKDLEIPTPVSPINPKGGSRIIPAATQKDLKSIFEAGTQDIIIKVDDKYSDDYDYTSVNKTKKNSNKQSDNVDKL